MSNETHLGKKRGHVSFVFYMGVGVGVGGGGAKYLHFFLTKWGVRNILGHGRIGGAKHFRISLFGGAKHFHVPPKGGTKHFEVDWEFSPNRLCRVKHEHLLRAQIKIWN